MPLWPLPRLALIVATLGLLYQSFIDTPSGIAASLIVVAVALLYYYRIIHPQREERWTLPAAIRDGR